MSASSQSRCFRRIQPVTDRQLWAPSSSTSMEITRLGAGVGWGGVAGWGWWDWRGCRGEHSPKSNRCLKRLTRKNNNIFPDMDSVLNVLITERFYRFQEIDVK